MHICTFIEGYFGQGRHRDFNNDQFTNSDLQHQRPWYSNSQTRLPGPGEAGLKLDGSKPSQPNPSEEKTMPYPQWTQELASPQTDNEDVTELQNIRLGLILNNKTKKKVTEGMIRKNESSTDNSQESPQYLGDKSTRIDENSTAGAKLAQNIIALLQVAPKDTTENNSELEQEEGRGKDAERQRILLYNIWKGIRASPKPEVLHSVSSKKTTRSGNGA